MRRCSWGSLCSNERFHVRPHDINDSAHLGCTPQLVHGSVLLSIGTAKRLNRCFHSDLSPELEAVRNGFRWTIDAQCSPFHRMSLDPKLESGFREVDDSNRRIVQFGGPSSSFDGKPDFEWIFASQFVV